MKTLLVLRHAQAVHFGSKSDHDRPLSEKGLRDAERIGRVFRGMQPDLVLCSTAKRAIDTSDAALRVADSTLDIQRLSQLYDTDVAQHLNAVHGVAATVNCLLIVGHNPTLESLVAALIRRPILMKTGSLAVVVAPIDRWEALGDTVPSCLVGHFYPGLLKKHLDLDEP
jgi:phosphohistidine phosphatase